MAHIKTKVRQWEVPMIHMCMMKHYTKAYRLADVFLHRDYELTNTNKRSPNYDEVHIHAIINRAK